MQELPTPTGMSTFSAELITDSASSDGKQSRPRESQRRQRRPRRRRRRDDHDGNINREPSMEGVSSRIPLPFAD